MSIFYEIEFAKYILPYPQKLKTQLTESQKELTKAQVYLTDYRQNLTTLQKQTDSLNKSVKRMERQRDLAWVVAGGLLFWGCSR